jgi:hypothetical protein
MINSEAAIATNISTSVMPNIELRGMRVLWNGVALVIG